MLGGKAICVTFCRLDSALSFAISFDQTFYVLRVRRMMHMRIATYVVMIVKYQLLVHIHPFI